MVDFRCGCGHTRHTAEWHEMKNLPGCPRCHNDPVFTHCKLAMSALRFKYWCLENDIDPNQPVTKIDNPHQRGRPKVYQSNAEKQREYRQRQKALRNSERAL